MKRRLFTRPVAVVTAAIAVSLGAGPATVSSTPVVATSQTATLEQSNDVLRQLSGTWNVRQRVWSGPNSDPVELAPATAIRRVVQGAYLDEDMTLAAGSAGDPFTRHATLSYNPVNQTYEYFSIDTRAPQMMAYPSSQSVGERSIWFDLANPFIAPEWGGQKDVAFKGRLHLRTGVNRQVARLYWTQLSGEPKEEFVAMEYIYTRT